MPLNTWVWLRSTTPPSVNTSMVRLFTWGAALETVKLRAADQAVSALLFGPARPWELRTRQKYAPAAREWTTHRGGVSG